MKGLEILQIVGEFMDSFSKELNLKRDEICSEAHISSATYLRIRRGKTVWLPAYVRLILFFLNEAGAEEFNKHILKLFAKLVNKQASDA